MSVPAHPVPAHPVTVHLVRHARHGLLPHRLAGRMPGVALDEVGQAQAVGLAVRFRGTGVGAVVSSPVQRARETAASLAAALGLVPRVEPGFEEIDFGRWTGLAFTELEGDPDWGAWNRLRPLACCPGGETMHAAQSRALSALWALRSGPAEVVVVSHADVIKAVLAACLGLPLDHLHRLTVDPASVSTVVLFADGVRVDGVNR